MKTALVLGGGGARGAYEAGVVSYLRDELGPRLGRPARLDVLGGPSVGAITCCLLASTAAREADQGGLLRALWSRLTIDRVLQLGDDRLRPRALGAGWRGADQPRRPAAAAALGHRLAGDRPEPPRPPARRDLRHHHAGVRRPVYPRDEVKVPKRPPFQHVWFRLVDRIGDETDLHRAMLTYASDFHLIESATLPDGISYLQPNVQMASLDHAMWFHRPFRIDEWLLYSCDSPSAQGARGLARGMVYTRDGRLVASTAQEGLIRIVEEAGKA